MWKLILGFIVFAAVALFILSKSGGDIDMSGEKHGTETSHAASAPAPAAAAASEAASAAATPASAASN